VKTDGNRSFFYIYLIFVSIRKRDGNIRERDGKRDEGD
jgi:hypothetical protein